MKRSDTLTQSNAVKKAVRKYDKTNITGLYIKLHKTKDKDIIDKLATVKSKQGYIKQCIREDLKNGKKNLDACCGSKMFWFDKNNPNVIFADNREFNTTLSDGRTLIIQPDEKIDFRNMPYADNSFKLVVFDPPHLIHAGEKSWLRSKYGILPEDWPTYINQGFKECMRVLEPYGVLIFKWNEEQIKLSEILANIDFKPLFGDKRSKTHWLCFMKFDENLN